MLALHVTAYGRPPVAVKDAPRPSPSPGSTLVRMSAVALGHLDRTVASGTFPAAPAPPYIPCGDGAGRVVESESFPAGALVWIRGGGLGVTRGGVAAQYALVPDAACHLAPPGADELLAACFFSPATSAHVAVHDLGRVQAGTRVLVSGAAGAVGSLAVQLALAAGARVDAMVSKPERAMLVPQGARVTSGAGPYDLFIDTVGGPALSERLDLVAAGGRAVLLGYTQGSRVELDLPRRMAHDVELLFLNMQRRAPQAFGVAGELLTRLSRGDLRLNLSCYPLEQAGLAWQALADGSAAGRVVLQL